MSDHLKEELVCLILQFLNEEGYSGTARMLEQESGFYFHLDHFEGMALSGQWKAAERYLGGFTKYDDNRYSTKLYFEMRKQNFLEALDRNDRHKALDILMKDLKAFAAENNDLFNEMTQLLTLYDIRENDSLSTYIDAASARGIMMAELRRIIQANPMFTGKLQFPDMNNSRLRILINQSLNWQHALCQNPRADPVIMTLFEDHVCEPHIFENPVSQQTYDASTSSTVTHSAAPSVVVSLLSAKEGGDAETVAVDDDDAMSTSGPTMEITKVEGEVHEHADLPKNVVRTFDVDSFPTSMDFHPYVQSVLLVGTTIGDISLWEVHSGDKLISRTFKVWDISACTKMFKIAMIKDPRASITKVIWSPDGSFFGVAYSKHLVQLYSYHSDADINQHLEIDAHVGAVTDLAFSTPEQQLLIITGGNDKLVKVWDAMTGAKRFTLEGHNAPIYSLCPNEKENISFIFSTSVDGVIKAWLYDDHGARVDFDTPGLGPTTMAYSADNTRLFSSGTNKEGESFLVEWDDSEGSIKRSYKGLSGDFLDVVQFETTKSKYLAAGDDYVIKFWDMESEELLGTAEADGDLPARPRIRFNKDGTLLAVTAVANRIKILSPGGPNMPQQKQEILSNSGCLSEALKKLAINGSSTVSAAEGSETVKESLDKDYDMINQMEPAPRCSADRKLEILQSFEPSHCVTLRLLSPAKTGKILKLIYTNAGNAILALASNAVHVQWKWPQARLSSSGMSTTRSIPRFWHPDIGSKLMTNEPSGTPSDEVLPCCAISRNDSYLLSASGGMISLFNLLTFKTITNFMPTPPAATCVAFYPRDNNVIAIGMDDCTIVIYDAPSNEIITKLEGHKERVTDLAFSDSLNVLVSSGGDSQIILWEVEGWKRKTSALLYRPDTNFRRGWADTTVQFDRDQRHLLSASSTGLAIYDAKNLQCEKRWPGVTIFTGKGIEWVGEDAKILNAVFSCDGRMVYVGFCDGSLGVFYAPELQLCHRLCLSAYLAQPLSSNLFPTVVAAHPHIPTQFAVGLSDGGILIVEPRARWGPLSFDDKEARFGEGLVK